MSKKISIGLVLAKKESRIIKDVIAPLKTKFKIVGIPKKRVPDRSNKTTLMLL